MNWKYIYLLRSSLEYKSWKHALKYINYFLIQEKRHFTAWTIHNSLFC